MDWLPAGLSNEAKPVNPKQWDSADGHVISAAQMFDSQSMSYGDGRRIAAQAAHADQTIGKVTEDDRMQRRWQYAGTGRPPAVGSLGPA